MGAGADCLNAVHAPGLRVRGEPTGYSLDSGQEQVLRYIVAASGILSLLGSAVIVVGAAVHRDGRALLRDARLISFLALTDACASVFNIMGGFVDRALSRRRRGCRCFCQVQAAGLLYKATI